MKIDELIPSFVNSVIEEALNEVQQEQNHVEQEILFLSGADLDQESYADNGPGMYIQPVVYESVLVSLSL